MNIIPCIIVFLTITALLYGAKQIDMQSAPMEIDS